MSRGAPGLAQYPQELPLSLLTCFEIQDNSRTYRSNILTIGLYSPALKARKTHEMGAAQSGPAHDFRGPLFGGHYAGDFSIRVSVRSELVWCRVLIMCSDLSSGPHTRHSKRRARQRFRPSRCALVHRHRESPSAPLCVEG